MTHSSPPAPEDWQWRTSRCTSDPASSFAISSAPLDRGPVEGRCAVRGGARDQDVVTAPHPDRRSPSTRQAAGPDACAPRRASRRSRPPTLPCRGSAGSAASCLIPVRGGPKVTSGREPIGHASWCRIWLRCQASSQIRATISSEIVLPTSARRARPFGVPAQQFSARTLAASATAPVHASSSAANRGNAVYVRAATMPAPRRRYPSSRRWQPRQAAVRRLGRQGVPRDEDLSVRPAGTRHLHHGQADHTLGRRSVHPTTHALVTSCVGKASAPRNRPGPDVLL
jgi:hypothetical protein